MAFVSIHHCRLRAASPSLAPAHSGEPWLPGLALGAGGPCLGGMELGDPHRRGRAFSEDVFSFRNCHYDRGMESLGRSVIQPHLQAGIVTTENEDGIGLCPIRQCVRQLATFCCQDKERVTCSALNNQCLSCPAFSLHVLSRSFESSGRIRTVSKQE